MGSPGVGAEGAVGGEAYWSALEARLLAVEGVSAHPAAAPALRAAVASIREEERREARGGDALRAWLGWAKERRRLARQGVEERPTGEVLAADQVRAAPFRPPIQSCCAPAIHGRPLQTTTRRCARRWRVKPRTARAVAKAQGPQSGYVICRQTMGWRWNAPRAPRGGVSGTLEGRMSSSACRSPQRARFRKPRP